MNIDNFEKVKEKISQLLSVGCCDSAETVCSLYLSLLNKVENRNSVKLCPAVLELLGDIIFKKGEFRRALTYYKQSSTQKKLGITQSHRGRSNSIDNAIDGQIRYKECLCHIELKDFTTAIRELEAIPVQLRDLKTNMCMGKLYKSSNLKRHAISSFTLVIRETPSAVEVIESLVNLGIESSELLSLLDESCKNSPDATLYSDGWIQSLATCLLQKRNYDHDKCEMKLQNLMKQYPKNMYLLLQMAKNSLNAEKFDDSLSYFKQIRKVDQFYIDYLDQYGLLLVQISDEIELNKLAHDILGLSNEKPIGWLLVAMYCDFKGDSEKAMQFVEKAISMDPKYAPGFRLKGQFLLSNSHPEQAVIAFFQAKSLENNISSFTGLIQAYLSVGKFRDAIAAAKESVACLPRCSAAYCLMGKVLAQVPEGAKEAVRAYTKALKISPNNFSAAASLAEVLIGLGRLDDAVKCLRGMLDKKPSVDMRLKLAKALSAQGLHGDAIAEIHLVLAMQPPDVAEVTLELERIELLMRGSASDDNENEEGVSGVSDAEVQGGEEYDEEEQIFDVGDSTEREGDRQVIGSASHQNDRSPIPFNFDDHDEEDNLDDDEDEDGDQNDRQVGVLLEYDSDPEDIVDSPQGTFLGTAFATEERNQPESGTGSGSASEGQSSSFYRTRNHVRNLNLQTPL